MKKGLQGNYKQIQCHLCLTLFTPSHPRQRRCDSCKKTVCYICGKPILISLHRVLAFKERRCASCYQKTMVDGCKKNISPIGTIVNRPRGYSAIKTLNGWKPLHRHVMEQALGRPLAEDELIHHINGDKSDNRLENLKLCIGLRDHLDNYHADDLVAPPIHHNGRKRIKLGPMKDRKPLLTMMF